MEAIYRELVAARPERDPLAEMNGGREINAGAAIPNLDNGFQISKFELLLSSDDGRRLAGSNPNGVTRLRIIPGVWQDARMRPNAVTNLN